MKDKGKTGVEVEILDAFPAQIRKSKGCGPQASVAGASCPGDPASALWCFAGVNIYHF